MKISNKEFFKKDTISLARDLLGKVLVIKNDNKILTGYIVETEAYLGVIDKACHSYGGKKTPKIEAMFENAGTIYIYTMHTHKMLNIVSCKKDNPQAVLIRAIEPIFNIETMEENRNKKGVLVSNGPGKLTKALKIDDRFNKTKIKIIEKDMFEIKKNYEDFEKIKFLINYNTSKINEKYLYIDLENCKIPKKIFSSARIGIPNKGIWTKRKLRFFVVGNKFVSGMKKSEFMENIWE